MPISVRYEGDVAVLGNFARLMNDPRHVDALRDVRALLDEGCRRFVLDLGGVRDVGTSALALLTTLTRLIRQYDGDAVLAHAGPRVAAFLETMRMDAYWDFFPTVDDALAFLGPGPEN